MKKEDNLDNSLKLLARGSIIFLIGMFISKVVTYLYNLITVRTFGQETYGLFSLTIMVSGLFFAFFSFGLQSGILRYVSFYRGKNEPEKIKSIVQFSLKFTLFLGMLGGILLFAFSDLIANNIFHSPELALFLKIYSIFIPLSLLGSLFHTILRAYEMIGWYSFIGNILLTTSQLGFLILFVLLGKNAPFVLLAYTLGLLIMLIASFWICRCKVPHIFSKNLLEKERNRELSRELLSYSWPIVFIGLITSIFSYIDSFSIGYFKTASEVGLYNIAVPISLFLQVVPSLFLQLFFPLITKEYSRKNTDLIKSLTKQISKWILILNLPLLTILILFPGAVISLLFGPEYIAAAVSLRLLAIGAFVYALFSVSDNLLSMAGKSKISLRNFSIITALNIVLNIILVPRLGIIGAAISNMVGYILLGIISLFSAGLIVKIIQLKGDMIKVFLVSIVSSLVLLGMKSLFVLNRVTIVFLGLFFALLYTLLILATKSFDKKDIMVIQSIKERLIPRRNKSV